MILFTPEQKERVARFAESLMASDGISTDLQRILIEVGRAVLKKRFEGVWLHPVEVLNISKRSIGTMGEEEIESLISERLPKVMSNRNEIDLGPIIIRTETRKDGSFYSFVWNFYALDKISEYEDQLLREANECPCHHCRARQQEHRRGQDGSDGTD